MFNYAHVMKKYGKVNVHLHAFLNSVLNYMEVTVYFYVRSLLTSRWEGPRHLLNNGTEPFWTL